MSMKYQTFRFKQYAFDPTAKTLTLRYGYDAALDFTETYRFDFPYVDYNEAALDQALQQLFLLAGVSYYKAYVPGAIRIETGTIDAGLATFLRTTYEKGLGEFWYVNSLNPRTPVIFPSSQQQSTAPTHAQSNGLLVGIGGGKDSLLSLELLRRSGVDIATWSLNHRPQLAPLVERIGLQHYWVDREWDKQLLTLREQGAYNGHIPISAIFAAVGTIVCILTGRRDHIVSNEQSANEPTLFYDNVAINHQYSKSQAFEQEYQTLLSENYGDTLRYYSLLRPLSELRIAELFAASGFNTYHDVFSSCNTAFRHDSNHLFWDGTCAKCAFVFLMLTPFTERTVLEQLFSGKNLLLERSLEPVYRQLLGIEGDKPLDCVGEIRESRLAMHMAAAQYPELHDRYSFSLDESYDYRAVALHEIPVDIWESIGPQLRPKA